MIADAGQIVEAAVGLLGAVALIGLAIWSISKRPSRKPPRETKDESWH